MKNEISFSWIATWIVVGVLVFFGLLLWAASTLLPPGGAPKTPAPLVVYCAAGLKPPVEAAAREYGMNFGIPVQLQYAGSGTLLANIRIAKTGDLYIAADGSYVERARGYDLVGEVLPLASQRPVIAVPRGNPRNVRTLDDLRRMDLRVELANPDAAAIGRTVKTLLEKTGQWADLEKRIVVFKPTVNDAANDVKLGAVDAGIVWDTTAAQYPELEAIRIPEFDPAVENISAMVLKCSGQPAAALRFAEYLADEHGGQVQFREMHFEPARNAP